MSYPPNFDYYKPATQNTPARGASILMYVLGAIILLSGFCCAGMGVMIPQLMKQPEFARTIGSIPNATPEIMQIGLLIVGVLAAVAGIAFLVLGFFVGRGSRAAIIISIVLSILCGFLLLLNLLQAFVPREPANQRILGACFIVVPLVLMGFLIRALFRALKSPPRGAVPPDYANQYWQYYQQQQNQPSGPYAPPAPPPQMFPPPPPPPPPSPQQGDDHGPPPVR